MLKSDIKQDNNNIKVQDKNQNISNEKKPEQSSENINFENMKDPFADIIENNTIISESKTENNNNVININNEQNKNELGNINSNPFGGEIVSDTIIKSDLIQDDEIKVENNDINKNQSINEKNDNINQVPLTNSNQAENKNNNNLEDKEEKLEFISEIILSNRDENQNNQK